MTTSAASFRVGKVQGYRRGQIWYLCYHENGTRRRPRVGPDRKLAKQMAAQINGQLEIGAPAALSFDPIAIAELRERWLQHHELVLRSSVQTIARYRTATDHLVRFLQQRPVRTASQFHACHAEEFVHYLRTIKVSPNGHAHSVPRTLLDQGVRYILELLPHALQLCRPAPASVSLRRESVSHSGAGSHAGGERAAHSPFQSRAGTGVSGGLR